MQLTKNMPEIHDMMRLIINSKFPQFRLLTRKDFLSELKKREIYVFENYLEYLDKTGLLRPCLRIKIPTTELHGFRYASSFVPVSPRELNEAQRNKQLEFPKSGDYKPWKSYKKKKVVTELLYHPWQLFFMRNLVRIEKINLHERHFLEKKFNASEFFEREKKVYRCVLKTMKEKTTNEFNPLIGLLMLLEEAYKPVITNEIYLHPNTTKTYNAWKKWKKEKKYTKGILRQTGFTTKKLKTLYEHLAFDFNNLDPINHLNPLPDIIKRSKRRTFTGDALIAQDYFDALQLISLFIQDLDGTKMLSPYDSNPWHTGWKEMKYGEPYDLKTQKTIQRILSDFITQRPVICSIIYEGKTEDKVIREIFKAIDVFKPETSGIHLYEAEGSGNLNQKNLDGYIMRANLVENDVYIIIDKDAEGLLTKHLKNNNIQQENCIVWKQDFELDNFGLELIIKTYNKILAKKIKNSSISVEEIKKEMKKRPWFEAINSVIYKKYKFKQILSKPDLTMKILKPRIKQIEKEYDTGEWKPVYPIEQVLKPILRRVPKYIH